MKLRDGSTTADPKLDRLLQFDPRSRGYRLRTVSPAPAPLVTKTWALPRSAFVDQGKEGACVSAGFGHDTACMPLPTRQLSMPWLRERVYFEAQKIDPWEGGAYPGASPFYEGTSVLAGAKIMQQYGFFKSYYWGMSIEEVTTALINHGSVVIGVWWTEGQANPSPSGMITYEGSKLGGHCVCVRGIWVPNRTGKIPRIPGETFNEPVAVIPQSWGSGHGNRGEVYMRLSDFERMLKDDGECCIPMERARVNIKSLGV